MVVDRPLCLYTTVYPVCHMYMGWLREYPTPPPGTKMMENQGKLNSDRIDYRWDIVRDTMLTLTVTRIRTDTFFVRIDPISVVVQLPIECPF